MDQMMEYGYERLTEKAQHRGEWSCWTFGPAVNQMNWRRKKKYRHMCTHIHTYCIFMHNTYKQ